MSHDKIPNISAWISFLTIFCVKGAVSFKNYLTKTMTSIWYCCVLSIVIERNYLTFVSVEFYRFRCPLIVLKCEIKPLVFFAP